MSFVKRDKTGKVVAVSAERIHDITEEVPANHPAITEFLLDARGMNDEDLSRHASDLYELRLSDLALVRVLEDVIYLLLEKKIVTITEFPAEAIHRLQQREKIRNKLRQMGSGAVSQTKEDPKLDIDNLDK